METSFSMSFFCYYILHASTTTGACGLICHEHLSCLINEVHLLSRLYSLRGTKAIFHALGGTKLLQTLHLRVEYRDKICVKSEFQGPTKSQEDISTSNYCSPILQIYLEKNTIVMPVGIPKDGSDVPAKTRLVNAQEPKV